MEERDINALIELCDHLELIGKACVVSFATENEQRQDERNLRQFIGC